MMTRLSSSSSTFESSNQNDDNDDDRECLKNEWKKRKMETQ